MPYDAAINVRLDPETRHRLERLAAGFGVKSSILIRQAVGDYLSKLETDGKIVINFRKEGHLVAKAAVNETSPGYPKKKSK